jgi:alpha-tubulin suppressor-like RCC1 family protein
MKVPSSRLERPFPLPGPTVAAPLTGFPSQVVATGSDSYGQLGDGTNHVRRAPILVSALGNTVTQVAAGEDFGVALKADGTVWTWGRNDTGQLGDGTQSDAQVPKQIPNLSGITQVSAGIGHVLALASDGTVWAWGANGTGQVGVEFKIGVVTSPTKVSGLSGITQVSAGNRFSLAVGPNGKVLGWGDNSLGELGTGEIFWAIDAPVEARNLTGVIQVAAGREHAVALRSDGTVWTWGAIIHLIEPVPQRVLGLPHNVIQVAAGGGDSFAVSADQKTGLSVFAWGINDQGRLGDGTTMTLATPVQLHLRAHQIVATDGSTAMVRIDGTVWAWGANDSGQLGIDSTDPFVATPTKVPGLTDASFVSMGHGFSLAVGTAHPRVAVRDRTDPAAKFVSMSLSADGGAAPYTWTASNLPPGLSVDSSHGVISGTPSQPSTFHVTATATDKAGHSGSASFSWTITPQIVTVPNVLGLQKEDAMTAMESVGLVLGGISLDNGCIDVGGTVLIQYPPAGPFALVPGASFRLTVSSGHDAMGKPCGFR